MADPTDLPTPDEISEDLMQTAYENLDNPDLDPETGLFGALMTLQKVRTNNDPYFSPLGPAIEGVQKALDHEIAPLLAAATALSKRLSALE